MAEPTPSPGPTGPSCPSRSILPASPASLRMKPEAPGAGQGSPLGRALEGGPGGETPVSCMGFGEQTLAGSSHIPRPTAKAFPCQGNRRSSHPAGGCCCRAWQGMPGCSWDATEMWDAVGMRDAGMQWGCKDAAMQPGCGDAAGMWGCRHAMGMRDAVRIQGSSGDVGCGDAAGMQNAGMQ